MKTRNKPLIAATVILSVCSVAFFALITYDYLNPESFGIVAFSVFEKEGYHSSEHSVSMVACSAEFSGTGHCYHSL